MILSSSSDSCLEFEEFQQQKKVVVILFVVYCKENDLSFGPDMGRQRRNRSDEPCIRFFWGDPLRHLCSENEISSHQNDHKDHKRKNLGLCPLSVKVIIYIDKGR